MDSLAERIASFRAVPYDERGEAWRKGEIVKEWLFRYSGRLAPGMIDE